MEKNDFIVTRAHLKTACENQNWDLLDKLLEIDKKHIDDNSLFTDTWGEWWGLLFHCIIRNYETGVKVLLKYGANKKKGNWGDCIPLTPIEAAKDKPPILKLLKSKQRPIYTRKTDPQLPKSLTKQEKRSNELGEIRDKTGLAFPDID
jgi:hypothetical protein